MSWLTVAILAYFFLAIVFLADKYLLTDRIPDPKIYAFYVGFFGGAIALLIPFVDFRMIERAYVALAFSSGAFFFLALLFFYRSIKDFELSRIVPAVGALIPLFSLSLAFIISGGQETLRNSEIPAFLFLVAGGFMINYSKEKKMIPASVGYAALTSLFFASHFILAKYVYMAYPFWTGIIWINMGGFVISVIFFFLFSDIRESVMSRKKVTFNRHTALIFFSSKVLAALGGLLQNLAIFLAPSVVAVAIINGLQGIQYVFLLLITVFISLKLPHILSEDVSKKVIINKASAILLILAGTMLLAFSGS